MEELVGLKWHRLVTGLARRGHPAARVDLEAERPRLGLVFRALGGDPALRIEAATPRALGTRRNLVQRLAGTGAQAELAWREGDVLRLPASLTVLPELQLNRDLYLWLAALASEAPPLAREGWFAANQTLVRRTLRRLPGLQGCYGRLVEALLAQRRRPDALPSDAGAVERAVRRALREPGSVAQLPPARHAPDPVQLWLYPALEPEPGPPPRDGGDAGESEPSDAPQPAGLRRQAHRVEDPDGRDGLLAFRLESLFSWSEYVPVDRTTDEDDDPDAAQVAEDLDSISLGRERTPLRSRLRLDLDLPAAEEDDLRLGPGIRLPEWDFRRQAYRPDHVALQPMVSREAAPAALPAHLAPTAARLRRAFQTLRPERQWRRREPRGPELDLDACVDFWTDRRRGRAQADARLHRQLLEGHRDLACLVLADLSLSTDSWVSDHAQVIDVIRDSLQLLSEALAACGDRFALYGFSSRRREHVRFNMLKNFAEPHSDAVRGRLQAIRPGYYTRMGAALRQATRVLGDQPAAQRLLLLLTDGKPNDLDLYEGRYGVEDTRAALSEARQAGVRPFCVTIDQQAEDYLPYLFGARNFVLMRQPERLPELLPRLYMLLTEGER